MDVQNKDISNVSSPQTLPINKQDDSAAKSLASVQSSAGQNKNIVPPSIANYNNTLSTNTSNSLVAPSSSLYTSTNAGQGSFGSLPDSMKKMLSSTQNITDASGSSNADLIKSLTSQSSLIDKLPDYGFNQSSISSGDK